MFELIVLDWYLAFFLDRCLWPQPYMILYQENFDFLPVNEVFYVLYGLVLWQLMQPFFFHVNPHRFYNKDHQQSNPV